MSNSSSRPLSPHLSVYKLHPGMIMSLLHRITGVGMAMGLVVLVWWLVAAAAGPGPFAVIQGLLGTWIGKLMLAGWTFSLFYHFGTGLRHLGFDMGLWLSKECSVRFGLMSAAIAVGFTLATWAIGCLVLAGK